ncbi:unnamed protein product [Rotaria socialis]|uniref:Uncharacterized protein n=1 Tax=Rotaria socialis TaxID=392032 RepID=A0A817P4T1_9BILA|nr:unnamed protein product [Rotaria socialis]CAF3213381.1 unnamed protein product [Rotaria socialis]CAF3361324.1 unnamed protein product [Rotaria socialis]CAF3586082.1 unnamed protein product [Rotaria socialis]CAF4108971.1 unnamed protein product [Rotaria socialis]
MKLPNRQKRKNFESNPEKIGSNISDLVRVQMTMKAKMNLQTGISTGVETVRLPDKLNVAHVLFNESIQQRLEQVSKEAERVLGLIIEDLEDEQDRLLDYTQEIQSGYERQYREWLQKYIIELDQWKSIELSRLHEKLQKYERDMNYVFQEKLELLNREVETAKSRILREEQEKGSKETKSIISNIEEISRQNKMQNIEMEEDTDIHLKLQANTRNKVMGENSINNYPYLDIWS